jgi:long-subunit fatty acid transport protein
MSFAWSYFRRRDDFSSASHPETSGVQKSLSKDLNYLSIVYPFELFERNMVCSLNYQLLYEFDRDIKTRIDTKPVSTLTITKKQRINFKQRGTLKALSPAYAVEVTPEFSLGVTFNIWTDNLFWSNGWKSETTIRSKKFRGGMLNARGTLTEIEKLTDTDRYKDFSGFNMHIGFLWDINSFVTIGGVVKTPFTADIKHERVFTSMTKAPGSPFIRFKDRIDEDVDLEMPLSYGMGVALRFSDRYSMSLDLFRTEWDRFKLEDGEGNRFNAVTGRPSHESSSEATHQVRLGAEYLLIFSKTVVPLRWGLFYDPEPSEKNPEDFWGFSLGTGISIGDFIFDCAYQFRTGDDVEGDIFLDLPSTNADVTQHLFMVSCIYHF